MTFKVKCGFILFYNFLDSFCKQFIILILIMSIQQLIIVQREVDLTCISPNREPKENRFILSTKSAIKTLRWNNYRQRYLPYTSKNVLLKLCSFQKTVVRKTCSNVGALFKYKYIKTLGVRKFSCRNRKCVNINSRFSDSTKRKTTRYRKVFENNTIHWKNTSVNQKENCVNFRGVDSLGFKGSCTATSGMGSHFGILVVSANHLPDFTTEKSIFTGLPPSTTPTPKPLAEFEVNVEEAFASFTFLKISWKSIYDVTKIRIQHTDKDSSHHTIEIKVNLTGDFTPNIFKEHESRRGFIYKLGSLYGNRRYYLQVWAMADNVGGDLYTVLSFLSGDQDTDDRAYNLNGIFLVLGISTIIMVVVMICVGYEKLLLQKRDSCKDFLCCRRSKQPKIRPPNGTISPEPMKVLRRGQIFPMDENATNSTTEIVRY